MLLQLRRQGQFVPERVPSQGLVAPRGVADLVKAPESVKPKAQKYICKLCGYIYDPETGDPDRGVVPGTAFEDMPKLWTCPLCGMDKAMFKPLD